MFYDHSAKCALSMVYKIMGEGGSYIGDDGDFDRGIGTMSH